MQSFPRDSSDPDARLSQRWKQRASTGKNVSFERAEWVTWDMFPSDYLTMIPFGVTVELSNGRVT